MGAPPKGKEATDAQVAARIKLGEQNRKRRKHGHYVGQDERGSIYRAPCGHEVRSPNARACRPCLAAKRRPGVNEFVGRDDRGWSWFRGECGHLVHGARTKMCRKCRIAAWDRTAKRTELGGWKSNPYQRVTGVGMVKEHRVIAEQTLGRKLKPNEVVHHINMDKTDNRRCNLLICTKDYHRLLHYRMQLATANRIRAQQGA